jgi:uncharacterized protein YqhQ
MYGGQAVIEGVMMRGTAHFAVACRRATGDIALTCEPVPKILRPTWQKKPLLRGAFALVDAMALGTRALFWAAKVAEADIAKPEEKQAVRRAEETSGLAMGTAVAARDPEPVTTGNKSPSRVTDIALGGAMATGLLMAVGLFKVLPQLLLEGVKAGGVSVGWQLGIADALLRFTIFFGYIGLVSRMKHVRRVFEYHGAEHKAINAYEAEGNEGLNVASARAASRLHPRCGTSFIVIVLLLSVLATSPFYSLPVYYRVPISLAMLPFIAGVAFELLRLAGKFRANPIANALSRPGMWTQLLTTREPDDTQLEVAIASLVAVMQAEVAPIAGGDSGKQAAIA